MANSAFDDDDDVDIAAELAKQKKEAYDKINSGKMFKNPYAEVYRMFDEDPSYNSCHTEINRIKTSIDLLLPSHPWVTSNVIGSLNDLTTKLNTTKTYTGHVKKYLDFNSGVSTESDPDMPAIGMTFVISLNALSKFILDVKNQNINYYDTCFKYSHRVNNSEIDDVLMELRREYTSLELLLKSTIVTTTSTLAEATAFKSGVSNNTLSAQLKLLSDKIDSELTTQRQAKVEIENMVKTTTVILAGSTIGNILQ